MDKKMDKLNVLFLLAGIIIFLLAATGDSSRTGFFSTAYIVGIIVVVVGIAMMWVPGLQLFGLAGIAGGIILMVGTGFIEAWVKEFGIWFYVALGLLVFLYVKGVNSGYIRKRQI